MWAKRLRPAAIWAALILVLAVPLMAAATSPLLAWRDPVYIAAAFAGVVALALMLVQPLAAAGYLPGVSLQKGRRVHRAIGAALVVAVVGHVAGLWITSPPDVVDALLFASPTPFSIWGVIAMWAVFATALLAGLRKKLALRPYLWRVIHLALAVCIVVGSVVHAALIEGTMDAMSKIALCALILVATAKVIIELWAPLGQRRKGQGPRSGPG